MGLGMGGGSMMPIMAGLDLAGGLLGGALGGGGTPPGYKQGQSLFSGGVGELGDQYANLSPITNLYGQYAAPALTKSYQATNQAADMLDPNTFWNSDQVNHLMAQNAGDLGNIYARNMSSDAASLSQRGLDTGSSGAPSSVSLGLGAYRQAQGQNALAGAQNDVMRQRLQSFLQFPQMRAQLLQGLAGQMTGGLGQFSGQQAGIAGQQAGLGMQEMGQSFQQGAEMQGMRNGAVGGLLGGLGNLAGYQYGLGQMGAGGGAGGGGGFSSLDPATQQAIAMATMGPGMGMGMGLGGVS